MKDQHKLLLIKFVHTLIWAFFVLAIFYVLYSGLTNNVDFYTWLSIALVFGEGLILLIFKMFCPLTLWARRYSNSEKNNFDIFLPDWLAKNNKVIFTTLFVIGLVLVLYRLAV